MLDRSFERTALLRRHRAIYDRVTEGWMQLSAKTDTERKQWLDRAFSEGTSERTKARIFSECLNLANLMPHILLPEASNELEEAITQYKAALWSDYNNNQTLAAIQKYDETLRRITNKHPELLELLAPSVPSLEEIVTWLPKEGDAAVLEFAIGETSLIVFLISRTLDLADSCFLIEGLGRKQLELQFLHEGWLKSYEDYAALRQEELLNTWVEKLPELIEQIKQTIFQARGSSGTSIKELLLRCRTRRLVIVPDGLLARLPLHAALDGIAVSYSPSAGALVGALLRMESRPSQALLITNPKHFVNGTPMQEKVFTEEADIVQREMEKSGIPVVRLENEAATSSAILGRMPDASLLHFCGHAESDFITPLKSHLKVATVTPVTGLNAEASSESSLLSAETILIKGALRPGACVVLTACESGISRSDAAGEFVGLPAAFLIAGAGVVISSLWAVDLYTPVKLMGVFYDRLLQNRTSAPLALKEASNILSHSNTSTVKPTMLRTLRTTVRNPRTVEESRIDDTWPSLDHPFHTAAFVIWGPAWELADSHNPQPIGKHQQTLPQPVSRVGKGMVSAGRTALNEADKMIEHENYAEAVQLLEQKFVPSSSHAAVLERLGNCYAELENLEQALHFYSQLLKMDTNSYQNHYNVGCVYRDFAKIPEAKASFTNALALNPHHVNSLKNLSELTNIPEEALALLKKAQDVIPDDADLPPLIAMWNDFRKLSASEMARHRLFWAEKEITGKHFRYGRLHLVLARLMQLDPGDLALSFSLEAEICRQKGDLQASVALLEKSVRLAPSVPAYWNNLGARRLLLQDESQLQPAAQACHEAIKLGDYSKPQQNLALIYLRLGELEKADRHAKRSLDLVKQQLSIAAQGGLVCKGCPTAGKSHAECQQCFEKAKSTARDVQLSRGDYTIN